MYGGRFFNSRNSNANSNDKTLALFGAVIALNHNLAESLITQEGVNVNAEISVLEYQGIRYENCTSLYLACERQNEQMIQLLLNAGANPNASVTITKSSSKQIYRYNDSTKSFQTNKSKSRLSSSTIIGLVLALLFVALAAYLGTTVLKKSDKAVDTANSAEESVNNCSQKWFWIALGAGILAFFSLIGFCYQKKKNGELENRIAILEEKIKPKGICPIL
jgi:ankyrin repeat protein